MINRNQNKNGITYILDGRTWACQERESLFNDCLPISRSLVRAHGGTLWLESGDGNGSAFFFTLLVRILTNPYGTELPAN